MLYQLLRLYMYHQLAISDPGSYIGIFLETDWGEAASYITWNNIALLLLFVGASTAINRVGLFLRRHRTANRKRTCVLIETSALAILGYIVTFGNQNNLCVPYSSFLITGLNTQKILRKGGDDLAMLKRLPSAAEGKSSRMKQKDKLTVIFVVGESVRADRLQIFGYRRPTTPFLAERKANRQLALFPNMLSYDTSTPKSVIGMFTNADNETRRPTRGSFVSLFSKHGFKTSFLYNMRKEATPSMMLLTADCNEKHFSSSFDCEDILNRLREIAKRQRREEYDQLIVIQTKGSHYHYTNKYPRNRFSVFKPDVNYQDLSPENPDLINSYDNTIVYLDYFLDSIMQIFDSDQAIVIYSSDHGESFGEGGRYIHGGPLSAMEQRRVPLLIWCSELYRKNHPERWNNLLANQSASVQHGNIFHTILGMADIQSIWLEKGKDLSFFQSEKSLIQTSCAAEIRP